jgi:hypothetical protein
VVPATKELAMEVWFGPEEMFLVSGETSSQVTDPVQSWLLDSPTKADGGAAGTGLMVSDMEVTTVEEMEVGDDGVEELLGMVEVAPLPHVDLLSEVTTAAPLAQGKRSKTVVTPAATKVIKKKTTLGTVRKSTRHGAAAAVPALEKAMMLVEERNLDTATAGTPDDFTTLSSRSDAQLAAVIMDSCMIFVPAAGTLMEAISLLRAKEEAQVALARVAVNQGRELAAHAAREAAKVVAANTDVGAAADAAQPPRQVPGRSLGWKWPPLILEGSRALGRSYRLIRSNLLVACRRGNARSDLCWRPVKGVASARCHHEGPNIQYQGVWGTRTTNAARKLH